MYDGKRYLVASSIESSQPEKAKDCIAVVSGGETFMSANRMFMRLLLPGTAEKTKRILCGSDMKTVSLLPAVEAGYAVP